MTDQFIASAGRATLRDVSVEKLHSLCDALNLGEHDTTRALDVLGILSESWASTEIGERPPWLNDITDDGTPFEFSVALQPDGFELRMLTEAQLGTPSPTSTWEAGLAVNSKLAGRGLASFDNFEKISELFAPHAQSTARFSLWHAAVLKKETKPLFKAYLNPQIHTRAHSPDLVREALKRLGLLGAWEFLRGRLADSAGEFSYFSLDLSEHEAARVKVYIASAGPVRAIESLLRGVANLSEREVGPWLRQLTGTDGPYMERPILVCYAFTQARAHSPDATLHVPIRCYASDDAQAAARIKGLLDARAQGTFEKVLSAVAGRPLAAGRGLITYASLRKVASGLRATAYLAPQVYSISPRKVTAVKDPVASTPGSVDFSRLDDCIERELSELAVHPLVTRIACAADDELQPLAARLTSLCMLVADASRSVGRNLPKPLAERFAACAALRSQVLALQQKLDPMPSLTAGPLWGFDEDGEAARDWAYERIADMSAAKDSAECAAAGICLTAQLAFLLDGLLARFDRDERRIDGDVIEGDDSRSGYALIARESGFTISADSFERAKVGIGRASAAVLRLASELLARNTRSRRTANR